jgi:hypothetical protein
MQTERAEAQPSGHESESGSFATREWRVETREEEDEEERRVYSLLDRWIGYLDKAQRPKRSEGSREQGQGEHLESRSSLALLPDFSNNMIY